MPVDVCQPTTFYKASQKLWIRTLMWAPQNTKTKKNAAIAICNQKKKKTATKKKQKQILFLNIFN